MFDGSERRNWSYIHPATGVEVWSKTDNDTLIERTSPFITNNISHETGALRGRIPNRLQWLSCAPAEPPSFIESDPQPNPLMPRDLREHMMGRLDAAGGTLHDSVEPFLPLVFTANTVNSSTYWSLSITDTWSYVMGNPREDNLSGVIQDPMPVMTDLLWGFLKRLQRFEWNLDISDFASCPVFNRWADGSPRTLMMLFVTPMRVEQKSESQSLIELSPYFPFYDISFDGLRSGGHARAYERWGNRCKWMIHTDDTNYGIPHSSAASLETNLNLLSWSERYILKSVREDVFPDGVGSIGLGSIGVLANITFNRFSSGRGRYKASLNSASRGLFLDMEDIERMFEPHEWTYRHSWAISEDQPISIHLEGGVMAYNTDLHNEHSLVGAYTRFIANAAGELQNETSHSYTSEPTESDVGTTVRDVNFVETWQDNRGYRLIDLCAIAMEPMFFHEFLRCQTCNGQVELKIPKSMAGQSCDCPHCGTTDGISWAHCQVPRPLK